MTKRKLIICFSVPVVFYAWVTASYYASLYGELWIFSVTAAPFVLLMTFVAIDIYGGDDD